HLSNRVQTPREWAVHAALHSHGRLALVFGPERSGLSNEELYRCDQWVSIPANPEFSALNIAAAVQILAYELRLTSSITPTVENDRRALTTHREMTLFYSQLERVMVRTGFLNPKQPRRLMPRLRRLFSRAMPDQIEMNILRGILAEIERKLPPD
ncbi:MAG: RNA methyltransferase, partial [Nevskiales bacterium]|nr:RNA methyltransferase [Nevskiales bacterium]